MTFFDTFLRQRDRWILWTPVFIGIGVAFYFSCATEPPLWLAPALLAAMAAALAPIYKNKAARIAWLALLLVVLGFSAAQLRAWSVDPASLGRKTGVLALTGRVTTVDALPGGAYRMVLSVSQYASDRPLPQDPMPKAVRIKLKKTSPVPDVGDKVQVKAMLLPISGPVAPGSYDFQRHAFFSGIGATGFSISDVETVKPAGKRFAFDGLRRYLRDHIKAVITDSDRAAIVIALLDGEDKDISKPAYETIRAAGIAHLIAISGLQVALVTGFFFFAVRWLLAAIPHVALHWPIKKVAAFLAMLGAVFYMLLIGESLSAERSVIMICAVMLAIMLDRDPFTLRLASFAAAAMLIAQPESLFSPGFQMSFGAVVALIAFYESTRDWWSRLQYTRGFFVRAGVYVLGSLATTLIATLATAPFALYHFLRTPLFPGMAANLVAVPLSSFVTMPAAITGSLLMPLHLDWAPLKLAEGSVYVILRVADIAASWPAALYRVDAWPMAALAGMCLGGLWIVLWREKMRWLGLVPVLLGVCVIPFCTRADVLVSDDGRLMAVRGDDGRLWMSQARAAKFVREAWAEREGGDTDYRYWRDDGAPVACDRAACIYRRGGVLVSFITDKTAITADCGVADVVISAGKIPRDACPAPRLLIDAMDLRQNGATALYFDHGAIRRRSTGEERGDRPWVRRYESYSNKLTEN